MGLLRRPGPLSVGVIRNAYRRGQHTESLAWSAESNRTVNEGMTTKIMEPILTCKRLQNVSSKDWRILYKHLDLLKREGSHDQALQLAEMVFCKDIDWVPRQLYEKAFTLLAEHPVSTRTHADIGLALFQRYIDLGHMTEYRVDELLETLYRIVYKYNDPFLRYQYLKITQKSPRPIRKLRREALYERLVSLYMATGEIEGAIDVMREAALNGLGLSFHTNEKLLIALLESGDIDFAWEIVYKLHGEGIMYSRTWGLFISYSAKAYHHKALEWAWKTAMIPGNVVLDDWCFLRLMEVGKRHRNYSMVRWAFLRYRQRILASQQAIPTTGKSLVPLIEAHALADQLQPSLEIIERLGEGASDVQLRDIPNFIGLVLKSPQNFSRLEKKFLTLQQKARAVDSVKTLLYNIILETLSRKDMHSALTLYREGQFKFDVSPNEDTILSVIRIACDQRDVLLIDEIISDCQRSKLPVTRRILEPAILSLKQSGITNAANHYLNLMKSLGTQPRPYLTD